MENAALESVTDIKKEVPREVAGSETPIRFEYQLHWAMSMLLEAADNSDDIIVFFDLHDDVFVVDVQTDKIAAYQVKTKANGKWTSTSLIRRKASKNGNSLSILGKLYKHVIVFESRIATLNLVTNTGYSIRLTGGRTCDRNPKVRLDEVEATELDQIKKAIQSEHALDGPPDIESKTYLHTSRLVLGADSDQVKSQLSDSLDKRFPDGHRSVTSLYSSIKELLRAKNNCVISTSDSLELLRGKALTAKDLARIIEERGKIDSLDQLLTKIETRLGDDGVPLHTVSEIRKSWGEVSALRSLPQEPEGEALIEHTQNILTLNTPVQTLKALVEAALVYHEQLPDNMFKPRLWVLVANAIRQVYEL